MNSPKPTRRSARVAQTQAPIPTVAYKPTPEDSYLVRGDSIYIGPYQSKWGRALFPNLYPVPPPRVLTRASPLRPNLDVSKPEPTLPRAIPGFKNTLILDTAPVVSPAPLPLTSGVRIIHDFLMESSENDSLYRHHWGSFPPALVYGLPPSLPVRDNKRARDFDDVKDRNVRQRLCF